MTTHHIQYRPLDLAAVPSVCSSAKSQLMIFGMISGEGFFLDYIPPPPPGADPQRTHLGS